MPPSDEDRPDEQPGGAVLSPPPPQNRSSADFPATAGHTGRLRPGRPGGPAARPPIPATQHRATAGLFVALLSLFGLLAINVTLISAGRALYVVAFTLLAGLVGAWLTATAIARARHQRTVLPHGSITALVIAAVGTAISGILVTGFALWGHPLSAYAQCLSGANTVSAQQSCYGQLDHAVTRSLGGPGTPPSH